jgi:hypothetical protein
MSPSIRVPLLVCLTLGAAGTVAAQSTTLSPSPTLPSDTLEANYAPRSAPGPTPELAPTLPSDTLDATAPVDSFPTDPFDLRDDGTDSLPMTPGDSAAWRELRSWIRTHPGLTTPPPVRAVLFRA